MNTNEDRKIIRFLAIDEVNRSSACESCGAPKQTAALCRVCAGRLVDIALSDLTDDDLGKAEQFTGQEDALLRPERRYYDHYEICQSPEGRLLELGRGAMGITYKATDLHLVCPVALKIVNTSLESSAARVRLLREARAAAQLRHPNIASIYHLGLNDDHCYYSMEYIEGETLESFVRRTGAMSTKAALHVVAQTAQALGAAHAQHFIHRDIKPSNIMLVGGEHSADGTMLVKLIDFGLVKALADEQSADDLAPRSYFAGTPIYASPEQLDSGAVDARSDIYSLGMCFRYMLTGQRPELPADASDIPAPIDALPETVRALADSMIAEAPASRPQTAGELAQKLQCCLDTLEVDSNVAALARPRPLVSSGGLTAAAALAIVCFVLIGLHFKSVDRTRRAAADRASQLEAKVMCAQGDEYRYKYTSTDNAHAIEEYQKAISRFPDLADAHAGLALAYCQRVARYGAPTSQLGLAVENAQRAIAVDPKSARGYEALGLIRSQQGRSWDALSELHRSLELDIHDTQAMRYFSKLWEFVGQPEKALPWARKVIQLEPANTGGWNAAADASVDLGADSQAENYYRQSLQINPTLVSAHCGLMHIHLLEGDFVRAREDYKMAESIKTGSVLPQVLKAQIEFFSGDYPAAEATYRRLLSTDRMGAITYFGGISYLSALSFIRARAGDAAAAELFLDEAVRLRDSQPDSDGPAPAYDLAAIRCLQGHKEDALALLQQAISSGWTDFRATRLDPRFGALHEDVRFKQLVDSLGVHVGEMRAESERLCKKPLAIEDYPVEAPSNQNLGFGLHVGEKSP